MKIGRFILMIIMPYKTKKRRKKKNSKMAYTIKYNSLLIRMYLTTPWNFKDQPNINGWDTKLS